MAGKSTGKSGGGGIVRAPKGPAVKPGKAPAWAPAWGKGGKPVEERVAPPKPTMPLPPPTKKPGVVVPRKVTRK